MSAKGKSVYDLDFTPHGEVFPSPGDWRDQFIYFLLVDRFDNNQPDIPAYEPASSPRGRNPTSILLGIDPDSVPLPMFSPATTDGKFFSQPGIQTYGFTPIVLPEEFNFIPTVHAANERIPVEALDFGVEAIYEVL